MLFRSVLALGVLAAGCGSSDAPSTGVTTSTVAAGDPTVPLLSGPVGDLTQPVTVEAGTGTAPDTLLVADIVEGTGPVAAESDTVDVRYTGAFYSDGSVFDSSWQRGPDPTTFPLSGVVPGFAGGIVGMSVGGRREIVIPPALGYGDQDRGPIPGGSTLVFVVDLVGVS